MLIGRREGGCFLGETQCGSSGTWNGMQYRIVRYYSVIRPGGAKGAPNGWLCDRDGMVTECHGDRVASAKFLTGTDMPFSASASTPGRRAAPTWASVS